MPLLNQIKFTYRELRFGLLVATLVFVYLGFYVAFNTVQVISRRVVGRAEETSTYSSLGFCTVNCRPTASNYLAILANKIKICQGVYCVTQLSFVKPVTNIQTVASNLPVGVRLQLFGKTWLDQPDCDPML